MEPPLTHFPSSRFQVRPSKNANAFKALDAVPKDWGVPAAGFVSLYGGARMMETVVLNLDVAVYGQTKLTGVGTMAIDKYRIQIAARF
jgi:hypothetical protein